MLETTYIMRYCGAQLSFRDGHRHMCRQPPTLTKAPASPRSLISPNNKGLYRLIAFSTAKSMIWAQRSEDASSTRVRSKIAEAIDFILLFWQFYTRAAWFSACPTVRSRRWASIKRRRPGWILAERHTLFWRRVDSWSRYYETVDAE